MAANIGGSGGTQSESVAHGLSYVPAVVAFIDTLGDGTVYTATPFIAVNDTTGDVAWQFYASVDSTHVYFRAAAYLQGLAGTFKMKYYLLQETAV